MNGVSTLSRYRCKLVVCTMLPGLCRYQNNGYGTTCSQGPLHVFPTFNLKSHFVTVLTPHFHIFVPKIIQVITQKVLTSYELKCGD